MNIGKYTDILLVEKVSKKTNQTYYAIVLRVADMEFVLTFLTKNQYDKVQSSLSN